MESREMRTERWARAIKNYFGGDLGAFYTQTANRLVLYPFIFSFFLVECLTFWLLYQGPSFFLDYMAFTTVYSLHKAAVYTICIFGADFLAHRLVPSWGAYHKRTVGRQWLIWSLGLAAGFILQRTMISSLVVLYAPDVVAYFKAHPQERLSTTTLLIILMPYWCAVMFLTMQVARSKQRIRQLADSLTVIPEGDPSEGIPSATALESVPAGLLKLGNGNGNGAIALADITHVTVEDHYCRISFTTGNGLRNEMIRLPLKELLLKLPKSHFLRIHRSHVVNRKHVSRLTKKGRDYKIVLQRWNVELPVSRSRFRDLHPRLKSAGISN
jgi:hypothetical protein